MNKLCQFYLKKFTTKSNSLVQTMTNDELIASALEEIKDAMNLGYLSENQVKILISRANERLTYSELIKKYNISCRTALAHCLERTCLLKMWDYSMPGEGDTYLCSYDKDIFIQIIRKSADEKNCVPSMYAVSLAYYIKKCRQKKAFQLLKALGNDELASHCLNVNPPSKGWIYSCFGDTDIRIASAQQIETLRRSSCDVAAIYFYFELHEFLFDRPPELILNMDETMLSSKRRFKVLAAKGQLPLIPETIKLPHLTGCVTFTAAGHVFDPLIILPDKKTLRTLEEFKGSAFFASSMAGWMTKNIFIFYCILLVCQISHYRLSLPENIRNDRILLIVDGHPSRQNFTAALILYLFNIDLLLIPPHTSHLLQAFDVAVASPLKTYFKEHLIKEKFDSFFANGFADAKQTAKDLRSSMIRAFLDAMCKSTTPSNIHEGFRSSGIVPIDRNVPLSSEFAVDATDYDDERLLKCYWLNCDEGLNEMFCNEHNRDITEDDFSVDLNTIIDEIRKSPIEDGIFLSELPPLFVEESDGIKRIVIKGK